MVATIAWIFCAAMTTYLGFWKGSLFNAPGLEDWLEEGDERNGKERGGRKDAWNGTYTLPDPSEKNDDEEQQKAEANGHDGNSNDSESRRRS